jgi:tRNA-specific adenosine deaminase 2
MQENVKDLAFMKNALELAQEAYDLSEVPVGCVFVRNNQVIATGKNQTNAALNV